MEKLNILICPNSTCKNARILFNSEVSDCDLCGMQMSPYGMDLAEKELALRSSILSWIDISLIDRWPGPIAFEYMRLKDIMCIGNIEGACWKIANLAEVTAAYFFSAAIEQGLKVEFNNIPFIGEKIGLINNTFYGQHFYELTTVLKEVVDWRNTFGVGHGSLSQNKEIYIENLIKLCKKLNLTLGNLTNAMELNKLCLKYESGTDIIGENYIYKVAPNSWDQKLTCNLKNVNNSALNPICIIGYQFSGPDIYFLDHLKNNVKKYKNFRQNRMKYLGKNDIVWREDPWQVAWLNQKERRSWFQYYRQTANSTYYSLINREVLADAVTKFQKRGMHDQTNECHQLYEDYLNIIGETENLRLKRLQAKYVQLASLGDRKEAIKYLAEIMNQNIVKASIDVCWYEGVYGNLDEALTVCERALQEARCNKNNYPLSATFDELELMKNEIYLHSRKEEHKNYKTLIEKCKEIIYLGSRIYNDNPENERIINILGFACNLYGDFYSNLVEQSGVENEADVRSIYELNHFGLKIRERLFKMFPDDVWAIRGYAWSVHCNGKLEFRFKNNMDKAIECLVEAEKIRLNGEYKYPDDLGLKEDLFENYIQYIYYGFPQEERIKKADDRLDFIQEQEGNSLRVIRLREKLKEAQGKK